MSSEMGDDVRASREEFAEIRHKRALEAPAALNAAGLSWRPLDGYYHIAIHHGNKVIDYWPSRHKWAVRNGRRGQGFQNLLDHLKRSSSGSSSGVPHGPLSGAQEPRGA